MSVDKRWTIGIIGMGSIGRTHAQVLDRLREEAELIAYSGGTPAAAADAGWGTAEQLSVAGVIAHPEVEVVVVCSPTSYHAANVLAALRAGKHVVVEKPMALTVADADAIVALARERGRMVSMISQRRFEGAHQEVKQALQGEAIGDLRIARTHVHWYRDAAYYASDAWRTSMAEGGGSVMNQGVHNIDLLQWLAGDVIEVTAQYATLGSTMEAENTTVATLRFASGALGVLSISTATPPGWPATITLNVDGGVIELDQDGIRQWEVTGVPSPVAESVAAAPGGRAATAAVALDGHLAQWRDILRALRTGEPPAVDVDAAARTVRLLCAIYEAAATKRAVRPAELS